MTPLRLALPLRRRSTTVLPARTTTTTTSTAPPHQQRRGYASPFFDLSRLSNSRETQHFTRASKLSRVEHSPPLKLIQTSEVQPFAAAEKRGVSGSSAPAGEKDTRADGRVDSLEELRREDGEDTGSATETADAASSARSTLRLQRQELRRQALSVRAIIGENEQKLAELNEQIEQKDLEIDDAEFHERVRSEAQRPEPRDSSDNGRLLVGGLVMLVIGGLCGSQFSSASATKPTSDAEVAQLRSEVQAARRQAAGSQDIRHRSNEEKARQLPRVEAELRAARQQASADAARHGEEVAALKGRVDGAEQRHAEWTRKATALKEAVERKDMADLTAAERSAYLEALGFLGGKDAPERGWFRGWFWKAE